MRESSSENSVLRRLFLRNVGGIAQAELDFRGNFTVLSGESGAGKSSVVRALELLCGRRSSGEILLRGEGELEVEAVFTPQELPGFSEKSASGEDLVLSRRMRRNGRSQGMLQSRRISLGNLGEAAGALLSIQSQHAQVDLLNKERQIHFLDIYGGPELLALKEELGGCIDESMAFERKIRTLLQRRDALGGQLEQYESLVERSARLGFGPRSDREWEEELDLLAREEMLVRHVHGLGAFFREEDGSPGLGLLNRALEELPQNTGELLGEERSRAYRKALELSVEHLQSLESLVTGLLLDFDGHDLSRRMERVDEKLDFLRELREILSPLPEQSLYEAFKEVEAELLWYYESEKKLRTLLEDRKRVHGKTKRVARELRQKRQEAAEMLQGVVQECLGELGMEDTRFSVVFEQRPTIRRQGAEDVVFSIARNGQPFSPLQKVASGGELSRILLSLHVASPGDMLPPVLVFDEVEAGLGGESALLAGRLLRRISENFQVILITHEASIAAMGEQHYLVRREGARTIFEDLSPSGRVGEIARMLSGDSRNPQALEHARALLSEG